MLKVLYITDNLKQRFGVTSVIMNYYRHIDKEKIHIDFMLWKGNDEHIEKELIEKGSILFYMPKLNLKNYRRVKGYFNNFFSQHKDYKIVHSHFCQMDSIIFPSAKKYGVKVCISHSHNTRFSDYRLRAIRNKIMCISLKRYSDIWAACSINAGLFLYGKGFVNSPKHLIINNGVNTRLFTYNEQIRYKIREEFGFTNKIVIGNIGSLKLQKNQSFLLDVMKELDNTNPLKYCLLIVGSGILEEELRQKTIELGIEKSVCFAGIRSDINCILHAIDIFALPSLYEGLPVVGIEAQAAGIPCYFSENITREVALNNVKFLSIANPKVWANAIINNQMERDMEAGKKIENKGYDINIEAKKLADFYERMVSN